LDEFAIAELLANDARSTLRRGYETGHGYMPPGSSSNWSHRRRHDDATVAKRSIGKLSSGGAKDAYRLFVDDVAVKELVVTRDAGVTELPAACRTLSHLLVEGASRWLIRRPRVPRHRESGTRGTSALSVRAQCGEPALLSESSLRRRARTSEAE